MMLIAGTILHHGMVLPNNVWTNAEFGVLTSGHCIYPISKRISPKISVMLSRNKMPSKIESVAQLHRIKDVRDLVLNLLGVC